MRTKIQKWGNSQGLIVAKPVLEAANLRVGEEVDVAAYGGRIIVKAVAAKKKKVRIEDLVAAIPKDYRPHEESFGPPRGKEVW